MAFKFGVGGKNLPGFFFFFVGFFPSPSSFDEPNPICAPRHFFYLLLRANLCLGLRAFIATHFFFRSILRPLFHYFFPPGLLWQMAGFFVLGVGRDFCSC